MQSAIIVANAEELILCGIFRPPSPPPPHRPIAIVWQCENNCVHTYIQHICILCVMQTNYGKYYLRILFERYLFSADVLVQTGFRDRLSVGLYRLHEGLF